MCEKEQERAQCVKGRRIALRVAAVRRAGKEHSRLARALGKSGVWLHPATTEKFAHGWEGTGI